MFEKEIALLVNNEETLPLYLEGMSALHRSGVFAFIRSFGRVYRTPKASIDEMALDGAYAAGFQDALDLLFNFKEKVLDPKPTLSGLRPDYGGLNLALKRGDLTEEEAHGIRKSPIPTT